ncbi:MAG: DUF465 domain-containing protein, partial [Proteobacteria bacterium]|nr:DUF465 domain-containing protein [Pseudomonadota bacterium]
EKLRDVFHEHQSYGKKIAKMEKKRVFSADDDVEMKRLKKLKLKKKEELEGILRDEHGYSC